MALAELPEQRIDSLDDVNLASDFLNDQYQPAIEFLLEDHDYDFATRRVALALVPNNRPNEWQYAYRLPSDLARPLHLLPYSGADTVSTVPVYSWIGRNRGMETITPFRIGGGKLYGNIDGAVLEYATNTVAENQFTAKFARALALELASRVVMPIKKDTKRQGELIRMAEVARERAKADDMNRDRETARDFIPEFMLARMGYGDQL
ncbi:hypothetical protein [Sphingobium baderi]|nr:hypothetical protein [Sphingobium baderi]KMS62735.1 hypothetical protein V475_06460 [Sphingobium baderi LL03]